ncbi:hypothetical protein EXIGLDRAFT_783440 [Exidia glandulosa HHB12029]|uniref:Uncharacterized protein n=1 Tax=Exidia glandulosa HHB12029 TaxID=1314781 RepID=A0A166N1Y7_EXIGL|nr:hypothetical protein EXIGLDRAFT_783440 [Exidia glandulosa HHB12029]
MESREVTRRADSSEGEAMVLDEAESAALSDLLGNESVGESVRDGLRADAVRTQNQPGEGDTPARRSSSTRSAASEAAREEKRRKAAHVLIRNFRFLSHPEAVAALRSRADDYVSTASWAADEKSKRSKPGMQGKSDASLRRIVEEMNAVTTVKQPTPHTAPADAVVNA